MSDSVRPHRRQPTRLPVAGTLQARALEGVIPKETNSVRLQTDPHFFSGGFREGSVVKKSLASAGDAGWEDPLKEEMATHCSILAWESQWTQEPGGLQFNGVAENRTRLSD